jgi:NAD(P)H-hydrate epimerase
MSQYVPLFSTEQARAIDHAAQVALGIPEYALMQRAGAAAWRTLLEHWPRAHRIGLACGPGNNGGDGSVLARLARASGRDVVLLQLPDGAPRSDAARQAIAGWKADGGEVQVFDGKLPQVDLWVDALFGIGLTREPEGAARGLIEAINASGTDVFALDVPSGVDSDSGNVPGVAIRATRTLGFIVDKRGLHTGAALEHVGVLQIDALGVPKTTFAGHARAARLVRISALAKWLPQRHRNANKGDFGHVLCVGGDHGTAGAIALTSEAALRCGAGLVSVATRADHVVMLLARRPELMVRGIEARTPDEMGGFQALCERASVLAIGPGLGRGEWGRAMLAAVFHAGKPLVLDADALNLIAESPKAKPLRDAIITPHPGEAARLLGSTADDVQADRYAAVQELAARYACCVVLKGAGTVVAAPDAKPVVIAAGNAGMATGGMGDVLTGVIAAMRAQHLPAFEAAVCGALLHGLAGDSAAGKGGERGLLASDLLWQLRRRANP